MNSDESKQTQTVFVIVLGALIRTLFNRMFTDYNAVPSVMYIKFRDGTVVSMNADVWDYTLNVYFPNGIMRCTDFILTKLDGIGE